ncbi:hypothetical protein [Jannaschia formosa]|nr:hypothetical protein [Jannaschia formosa]
MSMMSTPRNLELCSVPKGEEDALIVDVETHGMALRELRLGGREEAAV